jgi:hypothetical protein
VVRQEINGNLLELPGSLEEVSDIASRVEAAGSGFQYVDVSPNLSTTDTLGR